jgi:hypothetical protein
MKVVFEQEALEEYRDAAFYSEKRFGLGLDFVKAVKEATTSITIAPERFQLVRNDIRIFRMRRFPFPFVLPVGRIVRSHHDLRRRPSCPSPGLLEEPHSHRMKTWSDQDWLPGHSKNHPMRPTPKFGPETSSRRTRRRIGA